MAQLPPVGCVIDSDGFISTVPVKPVATLWHDSAQKIRRFTKPQRAREIDWEQKYRQKN